MVVLWNGDGGIGFSVGEPNCKVYHLDTKKIQERKKENWENKN